MVDAGKTLGDGPTGSTPQHSRHKMGCLGYARGTCSCSSSCHLALHRVGYGLWRNVIHDGYPIAIGGDHLVSGVASV